MRRPFIHSNTTKRNVSRRRNGYSLLEMLGYVAILAVGVNLCASLFTTSMRLSALGSEGLERVQGIADIEQAFRDTVQSAHAIVPQYASYRSGPDQMVLRAGSVEGVPRYIVLGALRDPNHLSKMEIIDRPGKPEAASFVTYALPLESIHFEAQPTLRGAGLAFTIKLEQGEPKARRASGYAVAALRGVDNLGEQ